MAQAFLPVQTRHRQKCLCHRPCGPFRQMVPVPFLNQKAGKMKKLVTALAVGLGLCFGGSVWAQESVITYPVIVPVSATTAPSQPAKAVATAAPACCRDKESCRDVKACSAPPAGPAGCAANGQCGGCKSCAACGPKTCCPCLDNLKRWCCYRALPCGCCCYQCCECWSHVWAYFPPDRGCCGCGYGCANGGWATGAYAGGCCTGH